MWHPFALHEKHRNRALLLERSAGRASISPLLGEMAGRPEGVFRFTRSAQAGSAVITRLAFWPPKPKEFDNTADTCWLRFTFGTTSSTIAGSGFW